MLNINMLNYVQFGILSVVTMGLVVILSIGIEQLIGSLDEMLVPCQHGTEFINGKCSCLGTPFAGQYCETCVCQNDGYCVLGGGTTPSTSIYGCQCLVGTKFWGYYCDTCNTIDNKVEIRDGKPDLSMNLAECELYAEINNKVFDKYFQITVITDTIRADVCDKNPKGCYVRNDDVIFYNGCYSENNDVDCERKDIPEVYKCVQKTSNCVGNCSTPYYGKLCDKVCFPDIRFNETQTDAATGKAKICRDNIINGGFCDVCNGHGTCGGDGCECDEHWYDYQNSKCSKTCGSVDGKICNGHGSCMLYGKKPGCRCAYGWKGDLCDIPCPGMLENGEACNNGGVCLFDIDTETTSCECNQKFRGTNCEIECPGKHLACDGHGTCNEIGECTCDVFPIKWEGEACNCSTPVTCNGHGFCKDNGECQCEFEYDPVNYCLECRKHFYGSECQFTCNPNGPLPEIELLDDEPTHNQYAIGIHLDPTFAVYDGLTKKTNTMYVYRYTSNFFKLIPQTNTNLDQVVASANEHDLIIIYSDTISTVTTAATRSTLKITDTTNRYFLIVKGQDEPLYQGKEGGWIQLDTYGPWVGDDKNVGCYENGKCIIEHYAQPREKITCECDENVELKYFDGFFQAYQSVYSQDEYCRVCDVEYFPSREIFVANKAHLNNLQIFVECQVKCNVHTCNNYGVCNENFGVPGQELCNCDGNIKDSSYCTECEDHWYPAIISKDIASCNIYCRADTTCNGHGACSDEGFCECTDGYTGKNCEIKCIINGVECSGHGKCVVDEIQYLIENDVEQGERQQALYRCKCDPQGTVEQDFDPNYFGEYCEFTCPLPPWKNAAVCNDLGECSKTPMKNLAGEVFECHDDNECKTNVNIDAIISVDMDWSDLKGPFCKRTDKATSYTIKESGSGAESVITTEDECKQAALFLATTYQSSTESTDRPMGCYIAADKVYFNTDVNTKECKSDQKCIKKDTCTDNYKESDCLNILKLEKPEATRSLNCTSNSQCQSFLSNYNWHNWCNTFVGATTITKFENCKGDYADLFCPAKEREKLQSCKVFVDMTNGQVLPHIHYCYEKDKSKYPFLMSFKYRWSQGTNLHEKVVDQFINMDQKYPLLNLDSFNSTNYCNTYLDAKKINVLKMTENVRYICNGKLKSTCGFKTGVELSDEWTPWSVVCDNVETQYHNLTIAIKNKEIGCYIYENSPRDTLNENLNLGKTCTAHIECKSGICHGTCCKEKDLNCAECNSQGICSKCVHGSLWNGQHCEAYLHKHLKYSSDVATMVECDDDDGECTQLDTVRTDLSCYNYCKDTSANIFSNRVKYPTKTQCRCLTTIKEQTSTVGQITSNGIYKICKGTWEDGVGCVDQDDGATCTTDKHCKNRCIGNICSAEVNCNSLIYMETTGSPDKSMTEEQCKMYADNHATYTWIGSAEWDDRPTGCSLYTDSSQPNRIFFNTKQITYACGSGGVWECVQKSTTCRDCIAGASKAWFSLTCNTINCDKTWVENEGCISPIENIEDAIALIDATCDKADSLFPTCAEPVSACDIDVCNGDDTCTPDPLSTAGICETKKELNCTCKYGFECERLSFTKYKCKGNFKTGPTGSNCHNLERDFDFLSYCKDNNPVVYYENFGDIRLSEGSQDVTGAFLGTQVEYIDFWIKTTNFYGTSASLDVYRTQELVFSFFLHKGQMELNSLTTLEACTLDNPTCHDTWSYEANEWYRLAIEIDWTNNKVTLVKGSDRKTKDFINTVTSINNFKIVQHSATTYYDEIVFEKKLEIPPSLKPCIDFEYCNFNVNYRTICSDVIRKTQYPLNLEPQLDIFDICVDHFKTKTIDIQASHIQEDEILALDWLNYCNFVEEIDYNYDCQSKTYIDLEDFDNCEDIIRPIDGNSTLTNQKQCILDALDYNWTTECNTIELKLVPQDIQDSPCSEDCWSQLKDYTNCTDRNKLFESDTKLKDSTCDWIDHCYQFATNNLTGVCSALECDCNEEFNIGVSGRSCERNCPIAADGTACAEGSGMGICRYTDEQFSVIEAAKKLDLKDPSSGQLMAYSKELPFLQGICDCFNSEGTNCDVECLACDNTTYGNVTIAGNMYDLYHASCDKTTAACKCLPPYIGFREFNVTSWKGSQYQVIRRVYAMPPNVTDALEYKIRQMQGKESFIIGYLDETTTISNWTTVFDDFILTPQKFRCKGGLPCNQHDVVMLSDYDETSARYNFDCKGKCPGTIEHQIPCSGHGRCGITGECICDIAKVYKGTNLDGTVVFVRLNELTTIQDEKMIVSRYDKTGWRGEACDIQCPGYDLETESMEYVCSGHGICNNNGECQCDLGYIGPECEYKCPDFKDGDLNVCSGHGTCTLSTTEIVKPTIKLQSSHHCPGEWGPYSDCDGTYRVREWIGHNCPKKLDYLNCTHESVGCDGYYSEWSVCHLGYHYRNFTVTRQPKNGGIECPPLIQRVQCLENACTDPLCEICSGDQCLKCKKHAFDIGFGCMCKKHFTYSNGICKPKLGSSVSGLHSLYTLNQQRSTFTDLSQGVIRHCSNEVGSTKFYHKCYTVKTEQIELIDEQKQYCFDFCSRIQNAYTIEFDFTFMNNKYRTDNQICLNPDDSLYRVGICKCYEGYGDMTKADSGCQLNGTILESDKTITGDELYSTQLYSIVRDKKIGEICNFDHNCMHSDNKGMDICKSRCCNENDKRCAECGEDGGCVRCINGMIYFKERDECLPLPCPVGEKWNDEKLKCLIDSGTEDTDFQGSVVDSMNKFKNQCKQENYTVHGRCQNVNGASLKKFKGTTFKIVNTETAPTENMNRTECQYYASLNGMVFEDDFQVGKTFYTKKDNTQCDNEIHIIDVKNGALECLNAAIALNLGSFTKCDVQTGTDAHRGCFVQGSSLIYYDNNFMTPLLGADTDREYICKYSQRPTCDNYPKGCFVQNSKVYFNDCYSNKASFIVVEKSSDTASAAELMTETECRTYANSFNTQSGWNFEVIASSLYGERPVGCYKSGLSSYGFNPTTGNGANCGGSYDCLVKTDYTCKIFKDEKIMDCVQRENTDVCYDQNCFFTINKGNAPVMKESECSKYAADNNKTFESMERLPGEPRCYMVKQDEKNSNIVYYNKKTVIDNNVCSDNRTCIGREICNQDACRDACRESCKDENATLYNGFSVSKLGECICDETVQDKNCTDQAYPMEVNTISSGYPDLSMTEAECKAYADNHATYTWSEAAEWDDRPTGCSLYTGSSGPNRIFFNTKQITYACGTGGVWECVQAKHISYQSDLQSRYKDLRTDLCKKIDEKIFIEMTLYFDRYTPEEVSGVFNCKINSDVSLTCAECNCYQSKIYGMWSSFVCDTCSKGYGKKQCRSPCPGYNNVDDLSMCSGNGMCDFGSIYDEETDQRSFFNAQCTCGSPPGSILKDDPDEPLSAINPPVKMNILAKAYRTFFTITERFQQIDCKITGNEDVCYHYSEDDGACTACESQYSGENCRFQCEKCLMSGYCNEAPTQTLGGSCECPKDEQFRLQASSLWSMNCCPVGFIVTDLINFNQKPSIELSEVTLSPDYTKTPNFDITKDIGTAADYCDPCPGVYDDQWLDQSAQYNVCGGSLRGKCTRNIERKKAICKCNSLTNGGFVGPFCRCKASLEKAFLNFHTDYGCYGMGDCLEESMSMYYFERIGLKKKCSSSYIINPDKSSGCVTDFSTSKYCKTELTPGYPPPNLEVITQVNVELDDGLNYNERIQACYQKCVDEEDCVYFSVTREEDPIDKVAKADRCLLNKGYECCIADTQPEASYKSKKLRCSSEKTDQLRRSYAEEQCIARNGAEFQKNHYAEFCNSTDTLLYDTFKLILKEKTAVFCQPDDGHYIQITESAADAEGRTGTRQEIVPAEPGTFVPNTTDTGMEDITQAECPRGYYQPKSGQIECIPAPKGGFVDDVKRDYFESCPFGQYQDQTGQIDCKTCPNGKYSQLVGTCLNTRFDNYLLKTSGSPDPTVTKADCRAYAAKNKLTFTISSPSDVCIVSSSGVIFKTVSECTDENKCLHKSCVDCLQTLDAYNDFGKSLFFGNTSMSYFNENEISNTQQQIYTIDIDDTNSATTYLSQQQNFILTAQDCYAYALVNDYTWAGISAGTNTMAGCYKDKNTNVYYKTKTGSATRIGCSSSDYECVTRQFLPQKCVSPRFLPISHGPAITKEVGYACKNNFVQHEVNNSVTKTCFHRVILYGLKNLWDTNDYFDDFNLDISGGTNEKDILTDYDGAEGCFLMYKREKEKLTTAQSFIAFHYKDVIQCMFLSVEECDADEEQKELDPVIEQTNRYFYAKTPGAKSIPAEECVDAAAFLGVIHGGPGTGPGCFLNTNNNKIYTGTNAPCSKEKRCVISNNDVTRKHYKILTDLEIQLEERKCEASFREKCHDCPLGTYGDGGSVCKICGPGTWNEDEGQTDCLSCPVGRYHNTNPSDTNPDNQNYNTVKEHQLVQDWEPAWKWRDEIDEDCKLCDDGEYQDVEGQNSCKQCAAGYYQNEEGAVKCLICPEGKYESSSKSNACDDCQEGTYSPLIKYEYKIEEKSKSPWYDTISSQSASFWEVNVVTSGMNDKSLDINMCKKYANKWIVINANEQNGYTYSSDFEEERFNQVDDQNIETDFTDIRDPRKHPGIEKPYGCILDGTTVYFNRAQSTVTCGTNNVKCIQQDAIKTEKDDVKRIEENAKNTCFQCDYGTYQDQDGQSYCKSCGLGTYQNTYGQTLNTKCKPCDAGSYGLHHRARYCTICDEGKYGDVEGKSTENEACEDCPGGRYLEDNTQDPRNGNTFDYITASGLHDDVDDCALCGAGKYSTETGASVSSKCKNCLAGTYQDTEGNTACKNCPNGKYESRLGSKLCIECDPGRFGTVEGQTSVDAGCKYCPKGQYQDQNGRTSCIGCVKGKYHNQNGGTSSASCKLCPQGQYQDTAGSSSCKNCGSNQGTGGSSYEGMQASFWGFGWTWIGISEANYRAGPGGATSSSSCKTCEVLLNPDPLNQGTSHYTSNGPCSASCCGSGTYSRQYWKGEVWGPRCSLPSAPGGSCDQGSCWSYGKYCETYGCGGPSDCPDGYSKSGCQSPCAWCGTNYNPDTQPSDCGWWGYGQRDECKKACYRI